MFMHEFFSKDTDYVNYYMYGFSANNDVTR
jgi:hypothetical protein